ncbi:2-amino-4-hydroxy-6-hydroxymethyldihydropteridine diphosphokinase [Halomonas denitrificans]|nr:2-amino-4-hydroxy-6-hydroxymethyldihydropteridine diphosphokinase [Halomonas denitrificans]
MTRAFVGIGSNLGGPARRVLDAIDALGRLPDTEPGRRSPLYRTAPWGETDQPDFVNAVAELRTALDPEALLDELQRLETEAGRVRDPEHRWGPRVLDLDLLWFGGLEIDTPRLTVPHPRMHERAFVLQPLCDLEPRLELPRGRVDALLAELGPVGIDRVPEEDPETDPEDVEGRREPTA